MNGPGVCSLISATALIVTAGLVPAMVNAEMVATVTGDPRVDRLLSTMTLEEKMALVHGAPEPPAQSVGQAGYLPGVPRLGIPGLRFADGPPGVLARHPTQALPATMAVAATFSRATARENGVAIGAQARALGIDVSLQPFVNIDRDLSFDRAYNTFGEDPLLTSEMAVAHVDGIQSQHVMAQIKHFIAYDSQGSDIAVDDQTLHEVYLAPFDAAVRRAHAASIMCSYNRLNGPYACASPATLTRILRGELNFKGFVTSDWGAIHAVDAINAGVDIEMPGSPGSMPLPSYFDSGPVVPMPPGDVIGAMMEGFGATVPEEPVRDDHVAGFEPPTTTKKMPEALRDGSVTPDTITRAAGHVLYQIVHFGYLDGQSKHTLTAQPIAEIAAISQRTAERAAVLLKNDGGLPLTAAELDDVVLIGPTAGQVDAIGISGERGMGLVERQVGPYEALRTLSGRTGLQFAVADDMTGSPVPASALMHNGIPGLQRETAAGTQVDATLDFTRGRGNALAPDARATWTGELLVEHGGTYWLYLQALGTNAVLKIDGKKLGRTGATQGIGHGDTLQANQDNVLPTTDGLDNVRRAIELSAGTHRVEVSITPDSSGAPVQVRLNWYTPEQRRADHDAAIAAARRAKVAVVFAWARVRPVFSLPGDQDRLIEEIAAVNPRTIVVLNTSQPVALPWRDHVRAILQMWWPGDEGGTATARVLLGAVSPAGRLPMTWGARIQDYPASDPRYPERTAAGVDGKTTYSEGVDVGYRWFDRQHHEPLYPFGHGLSYTSFEYAALRVARRPDGGLDVGFILRNTGATDSDEVPQVYVGAPSPAPQGAAFPVRVLGAFDRIHLRAGTSRKVVLHVGARQLQFWSAQQARWIFAQGTRVISVGASERDLRLRDSVRF